MAVRWRQKLRLFTKDYVFENETDLKVSYAAISDAIRRHGANARQQKEGNSSTI